MKYLITGGAGFIGSHLADALTTRGDEVVVLDDLSTGARENIQHLLAAGEAELVEGSTSSEALVDELMESVDGCFHLASAVGVQLVVDKPLACLLNNMRGLDVVLAAATRHNRWLLFTSTSEVYGKNSGEALGEESDRIIGSPFKARWGYAITKSLGEALAHAYHREQGARLVATRLFNTTGPRQTGAYGMVLPRFVRQAIQGRDLTVYGDGTQSRCFVHVLDTVHALLQLTDVEEAIGNVYNIGSSVETAIIELAGRVIARTGSDSKVRLVPYGEAYDEGFEELGRRQPDTSAIAELVGWQPSRTLDETIDDLVAFERGRTQPVTGSLRVAG